MNLAEMSLPELEELMRKAAGEADKKRATHKKDVRKRCLDLIKSNGLTLADVFPAAAGTGAGKIDTTAKGPITNPDTGDVWEGKGRKPKWLLKAEKEARALEEAQGGYDGVGV